MLRCDWTKKICIVFIAFFIFGQKTRALSVSIQSSIDTTIATIGDRVHLSVDMRYPAEYRFDVPSLDDKLGDWDVIDQQLSEPQRIKDGFLQSWTLELTVFDTGKIVIPAVEIQAVHQSDSSMVMTFETDEYTVDVISVLPPGTTEPKDIKPPFAMRKIVPWSVIFFVLLVLAILLAWWFYYRHWKRRQAPAPLDENFLEAPHLTAFRKLETLKNTAHPDEAAVRQYYFKLSEILREYLERRYFINALEMTSREILDAFDQIGEPDEEIRSGFKTLFNDLDLVKFAKFVPLSEAMITAWEQTYNCIDRTKREPFLDRRSS